MIIEGSPQLLLSLIYVGYSTFITNMQAHKAAEFADQARKRAARFSAPTSLPPLEEDTKVISLER